MKHRFSYGLVTPVMTSLLAFSSQQATAADPQEVTVRYSRADLGSDQGVKTVYRKVEYAAWIACETPRTGDETFADNEKDRACQSDQVSRTVKTIDDQRLTQYHEAHARQAPNRARGR